MDDVALPAARRRLDDMTAVSIREMVLEHDAKLDSLIAWRSEIRGALGLMRVAFGASLEPSRGIWRASVEVIR